MALYKLPSLEYGYDALNVAISEETMYLHHRKHHQAYVDNLNSLIDVLPKEFHYADVGELVRHLEEIPPLVRKSIRNNGGGHYNHSQFWKWLSPDGGGEPTGETAKLINKGYGGFQQFVDKFTTEALTLFGSGWVWLQPTGEIITTPNQDNPIMQGLLNPILGLDVWEHAYYLNYKNERTRYIEAWWEVVNWAEVEKRLGSVIIS